MDTALPLLQQPAPSPSLASNISYLCWRKRHRIAKNGFFTRRDRLCGNGLPIRWQLDGWLFGQVVSLIFL